MPARLLAASASAAIPAVAAEADFQRQQDADDRDHERDELDGLALAHRVCLRPRLTARRAGSRTVDVTIRARLPGQMPYRGTRAGAVGNARAVGALSSVVGSCGPVDTPREYSLRVTIATSK